MKHLVRNLAAAGCVAILMLAAQSSAQQYPSRPIRIIVPFAPVGPTDVIARLVGQKLTEAWGQQVVVDNRAGAGGNIGMGIAANAPADGYTILFVSSSFMVNPSLYKKIPYDPYKSFIPVSNLAASTHVFFTHPSQPVKTLGELIDVVKKDPKKYSMASPGIGTVPHLSAILLGLDAKLDLVTVPYPGGGPSLVAVVGNQVPFGCQAIPPVTPYIQAGRVRALAVTSAQRTPIVPEVPTMAELGFKGHEAETITGMLVPAGTPGAIVRKLHAEVARIIALPDVKQRITDMGADIIVSSPPQFTAQIKNEVARWGKVIKAANITVQ
ncbi:MAG: tripartite tricarboxylate transporter substrate binding protein [Betaproteobacteria bacterium]|nr:tripartite tricarboxylate transporter substrate binding protein [Betaproteobacteria bacterium]